MKTPRKLLLARHQAAGPKLDRIRNEALNREFRPVAVPEIRAAESAALPLRWLLLFRNEILLPFRWHLAGMSAVWVATALLNLDPASAPTTKLVRQANPAPPAILALLREHHRQISELLVSPGAAGEPPAVPTFVPKRRSERPPQSLMA